MTNPELIDIARAWLDWYNAAGVDSVVDDVAINWLERGDRAPGAGFKRQGLEPAGAHVQPAAETAATPPVASQAFRTEPSRPPTVAPVKARPQTPLAASEAESEARRMARQADSLVALEDALRRFDGCGLKATAKNLCFYRGAAQARLMLIGEAPGRDEDLEGRPFVGRAGKLLDKMLAAIGLGEDDVHITNIVYWRPPGNRTPTPQEALACRPFLERQIELVAPSLLVAVGGAAAKEVLQTADGIMRLRGKWRDVEIEGRKVKALATLHPAYLLRTPDAKKLAWQDLLRIRASLDDLN